MATKYPFTEEQLAECIKDYPTTLSSELAKRYNCSIYKINNISTKYGLKKDVEFMAAVARKNMQREDHPARKYWIKKGDAPPNKGKKQTEYMTPEAIAKTAKTRFKKGNTPHNHKPVGYQRITQDGYIEVKTEEPNIFKLKHRLVWEKEFGEIPAGNNIQFKDGNRLNCELENLYIITRAEQLGVNNSIHRYPEELKKAMRMLGKLNKQLKKESHGN